MDVSTLTLHTDKTSYTEGEPILVTSTGTVTRTTVTTETVGLDGVTTTNETFHADNATITHTAVADMQPQMVPQSITATLGNTNPIVATFNLSDGVTTVTATTPYPTVTAKPVPVPAKPWLVQAGHIRYGCAFGNNTVPTAHETAAGKAVGVRRTYFNLTAGNIANAIPICKADAAAHRVPWISFKPDPYTWASIGSGQADGTILGMINQLKTVPGPVLLTPHHEPDEEYGGTRGTLVDWKAMNVKYRNLITQSGATNIALGPIWMAWSWTSTVTGNHKATDAWFEPAAKWDFLGIDAYWQAGATQDDGNGLSLFGTWAAKYNLPIAVGEFGYHETGTQRQADFLKSAYDKFVKAGYFGAAYFDVGQSLLGGPSNTEFETLVKQATSVLANQT